MVAGTQRKSFPLCSEDNMVLKIGSVHCAIKSCETEALDNLRQRYYDFLSDGPPDIVIELSGFERTKPDDLAEVLSDTKFIHKDNSFSTTSLIVSGRYDLASGTINITGERNLANPDIECNHLNQLLSLGYYSACKVKCQEGIPPAFLVHSCGILRHGQAVLFAGPCETGKTTIARSCGDYGQVLNDEMVLVSGVPQDDGRLLVEGVPILGGFPQRLRASAPLSCVFLLKQSQKTTVRELDRTEAFVRFMRQIIAPAYIGQKDKRAVYSLIAKFSDIATGTTPFFELEFTLDREPLWQTVAEVESTLAKRSVKHGKAFSQN